MSERAPHWPVSPATLLMGGSFLLGLAIWWCLPSGENAVANSGKVPQRVVCFSPALTEILYAIGAGNKVVGVTDFCNYPPEAKDLPRCGGMINPNMEQLVKLAPDLVVLQGENEKVREFCASSGLRYWTHRLDSLSNLFEIIADLGRLLQAPKARETADQLRAELAAVHEAVKGKPPVRVFICIGRQPGRIAGLTTCGPKTFLDEVVRTAGGLNIFNDTPLLYPQPAVEAVTARRPDVILDFQPDLPGGEEGAKKVAAEWSVLGSLPAVSAGRVEVLTDNVVMVPGPRIGAVAREFARMFHPEGR